ncbi:MAG: glycosyltransferase family 2 protein [bacterium]|nr:glycosyltransferase family 2 protein [bacterium]
MISILFWCLLGILLLVYIGYPIVVVVIGLLRPSPRKIPYEKLPKVAIVVAAHNEEEVIGEKLNNLLKLDYPPELLEIIVASDGSTDRTNEITESYSVTEPRIRLMKMEPRGGKTPAMNRALHFTDAEIVVFTDAEPIIDRMALRYLVPHFANPEVGVVCGNSLYGKGENYKGSEQERIYWRVENWIKLAESNAFRLPIGGIGDLFAVRRNCAEELPANINHDMMLVLRIRAKGMLVLLEPNACAYAKGSRKVVTEYRRKVRIVFRAAYSLWWARKILNPVKHPMLFIQLLFHKLLRWLSGLWFFPLLPLSYLLKDEGVFYNVTFWGMAVFFGATLLGLIASKLHIRLGPLGIPFYVSAVFVAALHGLTRLLIDRPKETWTIVRNQDV